MTRGTKEHIAIIGPKGIPNNFSGSGGIEAFVENQIHSLVRRKKKITCYVRLWATADRKTTYNGVTRIVIPTINTASLDTLSYSFLASVHASLGKAPIVWYHGIGPSFFACIPKLFGKQIFITIHALDWKRKKWNAFGQAFLRLCEYLAMIYADKIFVVSNSLQTYYQLRYNRLSEVNKFSVGRLISMKPDIIRKKYNLEKNSYALYLGRFVPEKRIEWFIRASREFPDVRFVISGKGGYSEAYDQSLLRKARNGNIIFTGYVTGTEKAELLSNCALFVLPSMLEGYPVSIEEAMGYSRPCLVGDFLTTEYPVKSRLLFYFKSSSFNDFIRKMKLLLPRFMDAQKQQRSR